MSLPSLNKVITYLLTDAKLHNSPGKFTMWYNGRRAKQPGLMHAPGVARIFQRKI